MSLVKFAAIALAAATVTQFSGEPFSRHAALAQSFGEVPESFPIPGSLPDGTTLKVDGSTSMRFTNEGLEDRFEEQYTNVDVELDASRTDEAFKALIDGDIDLLATGRPLTDDEKAQGVVEVPLEQREKLAIILGPDNSFEGDLTFEQFASIFRGEITNWSELGGPDLAIRFVDRPTYSDTRRALSTYQVFDGKPFETGATADPIADDETDTVVKALGKDGIGYSVVSQVIDRDDLRIIPMHQTLPDDSRYPYSQYRAFVYKEGAGPAALAFLGFATTEPGQEVLAAAPADAPAPAPGAAEAPAASPVPPAGTGTNAAGKGGFPLWLLPLLAIPLLGFLLWRLLKGGGGAAAGAAAPVAAAAGAAAAGAAPIQPRLVLTPRDCRNAYAYWEVPQDRLTELKRQGGESMMVRLYDVTGRGKNAPLPSATAQFPCIESNPDLHFPIAVDDRSYCAEVGYLTADNQWLPIAKSDQVRVPVCPEGKPVSAKSVPTTQPAAAAPPAKPAATTSAKSAGLAGAALGGAALGGAALAGAAALGAKGAKEQTTLTGGKAKASTETARMVLTPVNSKDAYAYWEIPQGQLAEAKGQGGETMMTKLYDVTDTTSQALLPDPVAQIECTDTDVDTHFSVSPERTYISEVGYQTASGNWLPLAQSNSVRMPGTEGAANVSAKFPGAAVLGSGAALAAGAGAAAMGAGVGNANNVKTATAGSPTTDTAAATDHPATEPPKPGTVETIQVHSRNNAVMFDEAQLHHIEHDVASTHQLDPAVYTLRLRDGVFNYDGDDAHPGEAFVLLWIHGGTVINQKTGVPVSSTWTTLNGYDDTLMLDVREPATLCAFFLDTYPDDNTGEVTLSVLKH